jgi:DNA-binding NtrC family response regulator
LLENVGRLPREAQEELLGFLQLPDFQLRIVSTVKSSSRQLVKRGRLLPALAAALGVIELRMPPLASRPDDIPLVAQHLLEEHNAAGEKQFRGFVPETLERLIAYDWPGDVDELRQYIAETVSRAPGPWIIPSDLPERLHANWSHLANPPKRAEPVVLDDYLAQVERELIARTLEQTKGNKAEAARLLSISRPRLLRRLVQLGLATESETIDFQPLAEQPKEREA